MSLNIRQAYELLYGHPRETCVHCQRPKHSGKCGPQLAYERHATWELNDAERATAREDARREDAESGGYSNGSVDWESL